VVFSSSLARMAAALPPPLRRLARAVLRRQDAPPVGTVTFGSLRRVTPISTRFGFDRGLPVDRYYIESFLARWQADIRGRVLEVGDDTYTRRFGGEQVSQADILHVSRENPQATIIADLADAPHIPDDSFDCLVLTQTLHLIYDLPAAIGTAARILKPGGVLLATVPGISQLDSGEWSGTWFWSLTPHSAHRLFGSAFPPERVLVQSFGNVLAAISFLHGLAVSELSPQELDHNDPAYPLVVAVRAVKPGPPPQPQEAA
jgi:SAM-dependent methyltransferase